MPFPLYLFVKVERERWQCLNETDFTSPAYCSTAASNRVARAASLRHGTVERTRCTKYSCVRAGEYVRQTSVFLPDAFHDREVPALPRHAYEHDSMHQAPVYQWWPTIISAFLWTCLGPTYQQKLGMYRTDTAAAHAMYDCISY